MKFDNMDTVSALVSDVNLPKMFRVHQHFPKEELAPQILPQTLRRKLEESSADERIRPGMRIAITAGSRMIANVPIILKEIAEFVRRQGAEPFLVPAMGSHGGATAKGQLLMLETLGITEKSVGCPIISSMETVCVGENDEGAPTYMDRYAYEADGIIVCNRIKPHSGFRGTYESGLIKMMAVGLGKQHGAAAVHSGGDATLAKNIYLFGKTILEQSKVLFGVGILENAYEQTAQLHVIMAEDILQSERKLLDRAFALMPQLLVNACDVLIVNSIGKNYCGSGMDSNITGRFYSELFQGRLRCQRIGVLDLSEESHGNANGVGMADVISKRAYDKIDAATTYPNAITTTCYRNAAIPIVMMNDRLVMQACLKGCYQIRQDAPKLIYLKNTLEIEEIWLSEAYWDEVQGIADMEILTEPEQMCFDTEGQIAAMP